MSITRFTSAFAMMLLAASLLLTSALISGCEPLENEDPPPPVIRVEKTVPRMPPNFVFRPVFRTTKGKVEAGTAFATILDGDTRPIMLTALHLFGKAGGLRRDIAPRDLATAVKSAEFFDMYSDDLSVGKASDVIPIPEAGLLQQSSAAGDIAAMWISEGEEINPRPLARRNPQIGDEVWLVGQTFSTMDGSVSGRSMHYARVVEYRDGYLLISYNSRFMDFTATSGAPIINLDGEVVGINIGGGTENNSSYSFANPVDTFRPALTRAAALN